jgi:hypothetical protein
MGKPIVYCVNCGRSLREDDFLRRQAWMLDNRPWCATCKPLPAEAPVTPGRAFPARRPSSGQVPAATPRRPLPTSRPASKAPLLIGAAFAAAAAVVLAILMSGGGPPPPPPARAAAKAVVEPEAKTGPERAKTVEPAPGVDATDRYIAMIRELSERDTTFRKRGEAKNLIAATRRQAGARAGELDRLEADYDRVFDEAARKAAETAAVEARALAAKGQTAEAIARLEDVAPAFAETEPVRKLSLVREELLRKPGPPAAAPAEPPSIVLRATVAKVRDLSLKKDEYLGNWHTDGGAAEWMAAPAAGRWKVDLVYAADRLAGGTLVLTLGSVQLEWEVVSTGSFQAYRTVSLGTVEFPGGATRILARGKSTHKEGLLNLREIRLTQAP